MDSYLSGLLGGDRTVEDGAWLVEVGCREHDFEEYTLALAPFSHLIAS